MSNAQRATDDSVDQEHLERSRKVWDRWSDNYGMSERDFAPLLDDAVERLGLEAGDSVLEIGCGPGTNFERLTDIVGSDGNIVAVDYSPKMVQRARERAEENGWDHVEVVRADASSVDVGRPSTDRASGSERSERHASSVDVGRPSTDRASGSERSERHASSVELDDRCFDAGFASLSMSVMPDATAAAQRAHDALVSDSRFVVFDVRCIPSGPLRVVNPILSFFYRWYANWNPDEDVVEALQATFDDVTVEETYAAGAAYRALARKEP